METAFHLLAYHTLLQLCLTARQSRAFNITLVGQQPQNNTNKIEENSTVQYPRYVEVCFSSKPLAERPTQQHISTQCFLIYLFFTSFPAPPECWLACQMNACVGYSWDWFQLKCPFQHPACPLPSHRFSHVGSLWTLIASSEAKAQPFHLVSKDTNFGMK